MNFPSPLAGALFMLDRGCKVFPLQPNGKTPAFSEWQVWAEHVDREKVKAYAERHPSANWGVYCTKDLIILDVDKKKNVNGFEVLKSLVKENGILPETFSVITPTGGRHYYYKGTGPSTASKLGKGLDTRGIGGYVVAPGSRIDKKAYTIDTIAPFAPSPSWFLNLIDTKKGKAEALTDDVRIFEGERNAMLASLAGTMRSRGFSMEAITQALLAENESRFEPPLPKFEVENIARSIGRYDPSHANAAVEFGAYAQDKDDAPMGESSRPLNSKLIPKRAWIMKHRYISQYLSVLYSPGGVGKSTFTLLEALAIISGKALTGFDVAAPGNVWIYNTEDPKDEIERRIQAMAQHHNIDLKTTKHEIFFSSSHSAPFVVAIKDKRSGQISKNNALVEKTVNFIKRNNIKLFIIDPFVRTHHLSENDNMEIDYVCQIFADIAKRTNASVCVVHHARKNTGRDFAESFRGATSLINAARTAAVLTIMSKPEAEKCGIAPDDANKYVRLIPTKGNMSPPDLNKSITWFEKKQESIVSGDDVGVLAMCEIKQIEKIDPVEEGPQLTHDEFLTYEAIIPHIKHGDSMGAVFKAFKSVVKVEDYNIPHVFKFYDLLKTMFKAPYLHKGAYYSLIKGKETTKRPEYIFEVTNKPKDVEDLTSLDFLE